MLQALLDTVDGSQIPVAGRLERVVDDGLEPLLEPIPGVVVGDRENEALVLDRDRLDRSEPGREVGITQRSTQLVSGRSPGIDDGNAAARNLDPGGVLQSGDEVRTYAGTYVAKLLDGTPGASERRILQRAAVAA